MSPPIIWQVTVLVVMSYFSLKNGIWIQLLVWNEQTLTDCFSHCNGFWHLGSGRCGGIDSRSCCLPRRHSHGIISLFSLWFSLATKADIPNLLKNLVRLSSSYTSLWFKTSVCSCLQVSHDEHLISGSVEELWVVSEGKIAPFDGTFQDYKKILQSH